MMLMCYKYRIVIIVEVKDYMPADLIKDYIALNSANKELFKELLRAIKISQHNTETSNNLQSLPQESKKKAEKNDE